MTMSVGATELELYISNDGNLYRQRHTPIIKNLVRKKSAGIYKHELAVKLFMYLVDAGAEKYAKESGGGKWNELFPKSDRLQVAESLTKEFEGEFKLGSYDEYIPKKYQKPAPKKLTPKRTKRSR